MRAAPPVVHVGTSVHPGSTVLLLQSKGNDAPPSTVVVSKETVSIHHILVQKEQKDTNSGSAGSAGSAGTSGTSGSAGSAGSAGTSVSSLPVLKRKRHDVPIRHMALMHEERILITANQHSQLNILDVSSPGFVARGKVVCGSDAITSLAAHGETLAIGCGSGLIRVLTVVGGEYLNRDSNLPVRFDSMLTGHSSKVMSLDLETNGQLISGGLDRSVRIWDLNSGQLLVSLTRRWPGWGPVYSVAMLSAPLGTRCSIGEDTQDVAKIATSRRRHSSNGGGNGNNGNGNNGGGTFTPHKEEKRNRVHSGNGGNKKKAVAVSTGDGGIRVWSLEALLSNEDGHRSNQTTPPSCSRILVRPLHEGMFVDHSLNGAAALRQGSPTSVITTQMREVENRNFLVTGDTHGNVTIFCQLSWSKVLCFQATTSISSLSVLGNQDCMYILTNGTDQQGGGGSKTALLHTIDMQ
jgi:WD40 repeat protein